MRGGERKGERGEERELGGKREGESEKERGEVEGEAEGGSDRGASFLRRLKIILGLSGPVSVRPVCGGVSEHKRDQATRRSH